uniref:Uncharacterized protein n=1 Tax=Solanum lycopersicum TaxID=4081 RepID=A0A3Q7FRC1_SOLLC
MYGWVNKVLMACLIPDVNDVYFVEGKLQLSVLPQGCGHQLKKIIVCGFEGTQSGLEVLFLRDLLLISANIEMMVIKWKSGLRNLIRDASDEFVTKTLSNARKRSKKAVGNDIISTVNGKRLKFARKSHSLNWKG